jgi:hypothetical protein
MKGVIVKFSNGDTITTDINGTDDEIYKYYSGKWFDVGVYPEELMAKVVEVTILQECVL